MGNRGNLLSKIFRRSEHMDKRGITVVDKTNNYVLMKKILLCTLPHSKQDCWQWSMYLLGEEHLAAIGC